MTIRLQDIDSSDSIRKLNIMIISFQLILSLKSHQLWWCLHISEPSFHVFSYQRMQKKEILRGKMHHWSDHYFLTSSIRINSYLILNKVSVQETSRELQLKPSPLSASWQPGQPGCTHRQRAGIWECSITPWQTSSAPWILISNNPALK